MSEFQKQLLLLVLDKGLLALILGAFAFLAKRYLDSASAQQRVYRQKVAEERIRAYKEISRIVSEQLLTMARFPKILEEEAETPEAKEKKAADLAACYNGLVDSYRTEIPKLQADVIFVSSKVGHILIEYINAFGAFMRLLTLEDGLLSTPPDKSIMLLSAELSYVLSDEIENFRV
jgi:hypothetical protein